MVGARGVLSSGQLSPAGAEQCGSKKVSPSLKYQNSKAVKAKALTGRRSELSCAVPPRAWGARGRGGERPRLQYQRAGRRLYLLRPSIPARFLTPPRSGIVCGGCRGRSAPCLPRSGRRRQPRPCCGTLSPPPYLRFSHPARPCRASAGVASLWWRRGAPHRRVRRCLRHQTGSRWREMGPAATDLRTRHCVRRRGPISVQRESVALASQLPRHSPPSALRSNRRLGTACQAVKC